MVRTYQYYQRTNTVFARLSRKDTCLVGRNLQQQLTLGCRILDFISPVQSWARFSDVLEKYASAADGPRVLKSISRCSSERLRDQIVIDHLNAIFL